MDSGPPSNVEKSARKPSHPPVSPVSSPKPGYSADGAAFARDYQLALGEGYYLIDGARELCEKLAGKYRLYCVTNGVAATQHSRLAGSGLNEYFSGIFVSETIGHQKPSRDYFRAVFNAIGRFSPEKAMIVGDSLTSDIAGGKNTGIDTCWYNPSGKTAEPALAADYEIRRLTNCRRYWKANRDICRRSGYRAPANRTGFAQPVPDRFRTFDVAAGFGQNNRLSAHEIPPEPSGLPTRQKPERMNQPIPFTDHFRKLIALGVPIIIGQIGIIVLGFADTMMIGHYNTESLGAASFVNNLFSLVIIGSTGFSYGLTPLIGELFGANDKTGIGGKLKTPCSPISRSPSSSRWR